MSQAWANADAANYFVYGFLASVPVMLVTIILMYLATRRELARIKDQIVSELAAAADDNAALIRKYERENDFLREEIRRARGGLPSRRDADGSPAAGESTS